MNALPKELLHIYVIIVIAFFIIVCLMAASGKFDHWTGRFAGRIRRIRFRRNRGNLPTDEPPKY